MDNAEAGNERRKPDGTALTESEVISGQVAAALRRTFSSLRHREFLMFWSGAWLSNIGNWLQSMALGWLVLEMTNSSFYLGLVNFASSIPVFFFSFLAGIWADRLEKRRLIIVNQTLLMLLAFILGITVSLKIHTVALIMILAFLSGTVSTFGFPAWWAFISELVPRPDLMNAIALNSAQFQAARLVGPTLAGVIIAWSGVSACFFLNAVSFLAVIAALLFIRPRPQPRENATGAWQEFKEGLHYILGNRLVLYLLLGVGVISVFGLTFHAVLMPKFARDVLHGDARTFGLLMGSSGLGALGGALATAYLSSVVRRSTMIRWGLFFFSLSLLLFAFSRNTWLSMAALLTGGFSSLAVNATLNTTLQSIVPHSMRGRVMSFFVWMFMGWMPLGSLAAGALAEYLDPPRAVGLAALVPLALSLYLLVSLPRIPVPSAGPHEG